MVNPTPLDPGGRLMGLFGKDTGEDPVTKQIAHEYWARLCRWYTTAHTAEEWATMDWAAVDFSGYQADVAADEQLATLDTTLPTAYVTNMVKGDLNECGLFFEVSRRPALPFPHGALHRMQWVRPA